MASHQSESAKTLGSLPGELLIMICENLCPHCNGLPLTGMRTQAERKAVIGLKGFSETSRRFRQFAQPVLFHRINTRFPTYNFLKVLYSRKDLAEGVKEFHCSGRESARGVLKNIHDEFRLLQRSSMGLDLCLCLDPDYRRASTDHLEGMNYLVKLAIILLPNVETLSLAVEDVPYTWYLSPCNFLVNFFALRNHTSPLAKLHTICLEGQAARHDDADAIWKANVGTRREQATYMMPDGSSFFVLPMVQDDTDAVGPSFGHLKSLKLLDCVLPDTGHFFMAWSHLRRVANCCLDLEEFVYRPFRPKADGSVMFFHTPKAILRALLPVKGTLKCLDLDMCDPGFGENQLTSTDAQIDEDDLLPFDHLTTLRLDETSFCRHWFPPQDHGFTHDNRTCLTRLLGGKVKFLSVVLVDLNCVGRDIIYLADLVKEGWFPALEGLQMVYDPCADRGNEHRRIDEAFASTRIQVSWTAHQEYSDEVRECRRARGAYRSRSPS